jgi:hypothetical protein
MPLIAPEIKVSDLYADRTAFNVTMVYHKVRTTVVRTYWVCIDFHNRCFVRVAEHYGSLQPYQIGHNTPIEYILEHQKIMPNYDDEFVQHFFQIPEIVMEKIIETIENLCMGLDFVPTDAIHIPVGCKGPPFLMSNINMHRDVAEACREVSVLV